MATKEKKIGKKSTLSGSSAERVSGASGLPGPQTLNPHISIDEIRATWNLDRDDEGLREQARDMRGSGADKNSDSTRLNNPENLLDKMEEDSFPASDPPSTSPITGIGRRPE